MLRGAFRREGKSDGFCLFHQQDTVTSQLRTNIRTHGDRRQRRAHRSDKFIVFSSSFIRITTTKKRALIDLILLWFVESTHIFGRRTRRDFQEALIVFFFFFKFSFFHYLI